MNPRIARIQYTVLIAIILWVAACTPSPATPEPTNIPITTVQPTNTFVPFEIPHTPVVVDSDMGSNGVMAILYILQRPDLSVKAITVVGSGETHCRAGIDHALGLIALTNAGKIPVACGRETPLVGDHQFPSMVRAQADSSLRIKWPEIGSASTLTAAELLQTTINSSSQPVVLVADGPLTNVAEAILADPQLVKNIQMIYIMGGAIDVPGNLFGVPDASSNKTAEFNMYVDPHAANIVLNSGAPIRLIPLDATNQVPLDAVFYKVLSRHLTTPAAKAVYDMLDYTKSYLQTGYYFWDPLTYAIASDESLAIFMTNKITVIEEDGPEIGRTKVSQDGKEVQVAYIYNVDHFLDLYLSVLNGGQPLFIDWVTARFTPTPPPNVVNVIIQGGKCSLEGSMLVPRGPVGVYLIDKDPVRDAGLAIVTADEGKTLADLVTSPGLEQPSWVQILGNILETSPGNEVSQVVEVGDKPIYLVCFDSPPAAKIGALGPIEVIK